MNKIKLYYKEILLVLGLFVLLYALGTFLNGIFSDIIYVVVSSMIFVVALLGRKRIQNKGFLFIGVSYGVILVFRLLGLISNLQSMMQFGIDIDYTQFIYYARAYEILAIFLGLFVFISNDKLKLTRIMLIQSAVLAFVLLLSLRFTVYPYQYGDVDSMALYYVFNRISIIPLIGLLTVIAIRKMSIKNYTDTFYIIVGLLAIYSFIHMFNLESVFSEYLWLASSINTISIIVHITSVLLLLKVIYEQSIELPYQTACSTLEDSNDRLLELTRIDGLTMIPNRRFIIENLEKSFRLAKREKHSIALLMVDIDDFKQYNDKFGHLHGDSILKRVAKAIDKSTKRPLDLAGRYGGEEFLVILPNSDFEGASVVSKRIMKEIRDLRIEHYKIDESYLSVSIGFSVVKPTKENSIDEAILVADEFLYKVKNTGKNAFMGYDIDKGEL